MKIANAKTFGNNPYATASDVASAITSHSTNVGHIPSGGVAGEYLRKTENGTEWANAEIPSQMIDFTSADTPSVTWNSGKTEATFTHTLNCIPNVVVYDNNWELTYVTIQLGSTPNNSTFKILLDTPVVSSNAWHCIVTYGHHIS